MSHKFNVGDKVRIRKDLMPMFYDGLLCVEDMTKLAGMRMTIRCVASSGAYKLAEDGDRWWWSESMLEPDTLYHVGDTVKVRDDLITNRVYGGVTFVKGMERFKGKEFVVSVTHPHSDSYNLKGSPYFFHSSMFTGKVEQKKDVDALPVKVVIDYNGKYTTCRVYKGDNAKLKSITHATCAPEDTPDVGVGIFWALVRAGIVPRTDDRTDDVPKKEEPKPQYTGKVLCVNPGAACGSFTRYLWYVVKDGRVVTDLGEKFPKGNKPIYTFEQFQASMPGVRWMEIPEDNDTVKH